MKLENNNVPSIRFPEFKDAWEDVSLQEFLIPTLREVDKPTDLYLAIGIRSHCKGTFQKPNSDPSKIAMEKLFIVKENDLIVNITFAWEGAIAIVKKEDDSGLVSHRFPTYTFNENISTHNFFRYVFVQKQFRATLELISPGGAGRNRVLSKKDFLKIKVKLPLITEQKNISDFLNSIDEKIQQLSKKKDLLEKYKKAVMQKIFNQEIRFKDDNGNDFADWEEKRFGEVFSFRTTNSYSRDNLNYEDGEVKNIHYGDIHTKFNTLFDIKKELVPYINKEIKLTKISEDNYCQKGDLVIADASEDYAEIGKCIEIINLDNQKLLAGLHTLLARPDLYEMQIGFSGYLMKCANVRLQIMTIAQGTKVLSISTGRLSKIKLNIPSEIEQKKIVSFLSAIDNKINSVNQQLEKTQMYKKSLLQKMFI